MSNYIKKGGEPMIEIKCPVIDLKDGKLLYEVSVKGIEENQTKLTMKGIELLLDSIDIKTLNKGTDSLLTEAIEPLLLIIADRIGYENYYWTLSDGETETVDDELIVSKKAKFRLLRYIIDTLEKMDNEND